MIADAVGAERRARMAVVQVEVDGFAHMPDALDGRAHGRQGSAAGRLDVVDVARQLMVGRFEAANVDFGSDRRESPLTLADADVADVDAGADAAAVADRLEKSDEDAGVEPGGVLDEQPGTGRRQASIERPYGGDVLLEAARDLGLIVDDKS